MDPNDTMTPEQQFDIVPEPIDKNLLPEIDASLDTIKAEMHRYERAKGEPDKLFDIIQSIETRIAVEDIPEQLKKVNEYIEALQKWGSEWRTEALRQRENCREFERNIDNT